MKKTITIVGCGAVGASQSYHLVDELIDENIAEFFEILIFEKSSDVGRGVAYSQDVHSNILNRTADSMSIIHDSKSDFLDWLKNNKNKWKMYYPDIKVSWLKNRFLPRSLFGMYIEDVLYKAIARARLHKLKISVIHDEVVSINGVAEHYKIKTGNGWQFNSNYVILCLGQHESHRFENLITNEKFFLSPYPGNKLKAIPRDAKVGIIGARLSAIDAALALVSNNHNGCISFIAREGYLPAVKTKLLSYTPKILTHKNLCEIRESRDGLTLRQLIKLLNREVTLASKVRQSFANWFRRPLDPVEFYENEFKNINKKASIVWQSILIALNNIIEDIWNDLSDHEKTVFHNLYKSKWMSYRVGIPLENAKVIHDIFKSGRLSLIRGFDGLSYNNDHFTIRGNNGSYVFDYLIDATGNCEDLSRIDSALLADMKNSGMIKSNKFGGIEVDFASSRIVRDDQSIENNVFVVGNLTSGTYLFTSVLELNVKHALKIAKCIASEFISSYKPYDETAQDVRISYRDNAIKYVNKLV